MRSALGVIRYTTLEAIRKGTLIAYFIIGTLIILVFLLGIRLSPEDGTSMEFFGNKVATREIMGLDLVNFWLLQLYGSASGAIMLFGLFGTAGMIPSFVEKGTAELFLSKPLSRASLFISRFTGAVGGISLNIVFFTIGMWLVFGIKLGVWNWGFLASAFFTSYIFACFFSVAVLSGIITQSTAVAIIMGFAFSLFSGILETRELVLYKAWDNAIFHRTLDVLYYITPQLDAMKNSAGTLIGTLEIPAARRLANIPESFTILPFVYSTLSATALYSLSIWYFKRKDY
ncbi:MAG: ABC transporter permease [Ignavibacteriae bacterium]|nr:ABC transporter permease [Ignavibacteriota bacterium]